MAKEPKLSDRMRALAVRVESGYLAKQLRVRADDLDGAIAGFDRDPSQAALRRLISARAQAIETFAGATSV